MLGVAAWASSASSPPHSSRSSSVIRYRAAGRQKRRPRRACGPRPPSHRPRPLTVLQPLQALAALGLGDEVGVADGLVDVVLLALGGGEALGGGALQRGQAVLDPPAGDAMGGTERPETPRPRDPRGTRTGGWRGRAASGRVTAMGTAGPCAGPQAPRVPIRPRLPAARTKAPGTGSAPAPPEGLPPGRRAVLGFRWQRSRAGRWLKVTARPVSGRGSPQGSARGSRRGSRPSRRCRRGHGARCRSPGSPRSRCVLTKGGGGRPGSGGQAPGAHRPPTARGGRAAGSPAAASTGTPPAPGQGHEPGSPGSPPPVPAPGPPRGCWDRARERDTPGTGTGARAPGPPPPGTGTPAPPGAPRPLLTAAAPWRARP